MIKSIKVAYNTGPPPSEPLIPHQDALAPYTPFTNIHILIITNPIARPACAPNRYFQLANVLPQYSDVGGAFLIVLRRPARPWPVNPNNGSDYIYVGSPLWMNSSTPSNTIFDSDDHNFKNFGASRRQFTNIVVLRNLGQKCSEYLAPVWGMTVLGRCNTSQGFTTHGCFTTKINKLEWIGIFVGGHKSKD